MSDKVTAARAAWALIKLSELGSRPVYLGQLADRVGLEPGEALRLLRLTWRDNVLVRDGEIRLDTTPDGPRRYRVDAGGRQVGSGKGCSVDMYLLALALDKPIHAEATCPATGVPITVDITGGPDHTDTELCSQQPFFASAQAATEWLAAHPQGRLIPVRDFHAEARRLVDWLEAAPSSNTRTPVTEDA